MEKTEPQVIQIAVDRQLFILQQAATIDDTFAETLSQFLDSGGTTDGLYGNILRATARSIILKATHSTLISK